MNEDVIVAGVGTKIETGSKVCASLESLNGTCDTSRMRCVSGKEFCEFVPKSFDQSLAGEQMNLLRSVLVQTPSYKGWRPL